MAILCEKESYAIIGAAMEVYKEYIADFVCFDAIIIEIKALKSLSGTKDSQILNYLKATNLRCRIIINCGNPKELERKRFVH